MKYIIKSKNSDFKDLVEVEFDVADSFYKKLSGLMFKEKVERPLVFYKCKQIHTFFMKIPIDVYYLDKSMRVIEIEEAMEPNRIGRYIKDAYAVIETYGGSSLLEIGDKVDSI